MPLVWAGLWRRPVRSVLTASCIAIAFVLLGLLQGVNAGFDKAIAAANRNFLVTGTRVQGGALMPLAAMAQIRNVPNVKDVAPRAYFMQDDQRTGNPSLAAIATRPELLLRMMAGAKVDRKSLEAMRRTRNGLLGTPELLQLLGWKVGDTVTVRSFTKRMNGSPDWTFDIVGSFTTAKGGYFGIINYDYFDADRATERNTAEIFYVEIHDPEKSMATAAAIDRIFANSGHESRTRSQQQRAEAKARQMGDVRLFTNIIMATVMFTLAFLTGNTLRQSLQERSREFAVLKALGYSGPHVLGLAFAEALLLYLPPALAGLAIARLLAPLWEESFAIAVTPGVALTGLACAVILAFAGAALPAWGLSRAAVATALGRR